MMRAIDRSKYHTITLENLAKLRTIDPMRIGYYTDLGDKWLIEEKLQQWIELDATETLDLSDADLVGLHYDQYLCVADAILLGADACLRKGAERKLKAVYESCGVEIRRE